MDEVMRAITEREEVLPGSDIPLQGGFGHREITAKQAGGAIVTEVVSHCYVLSCGCRIKRQEDAGGVCWECKALLEDEVRRDPVLASLWSEEQLDWIATSCIRHYQRCAFPLCGRSGCSRHFLQGNDQSYYCHEHYLTLFSAQGTGKVLSKAGTFLQSLFFR